MMLAYNHNPRKFSKEYTEEEIQQALIEIGWEEPVKSMLFTTASTEIDELKYDESNELHMAIRGFSDPNYRNFVPGFDGYKQDVSDTDSLGSMYILKNKDIRASNSDEEVVLTSTTIPAKVSQGDKVMLNSGSPEMTIESIKPADHGAFFNAIVSWNEGSEIKTGIFPVACLSPYREDNSEASS
jgi:uncharacterized protein YodC (DUF2158 family)